jgi:predicted  nucleic acid-binding Zn-ribbon protein
MDTERIAKLEAQVEGIKDDVKDLKADVKEVHSRITTGNREILDKIDQMENRLEYKMGTNSEASKTQHEQIQNEIKQDIKNITDRVDVLERWRWMIVGGAIVIGYLVSHLELFSKVVNLK